ncbi:MAG: phosphoenolpyruvate synthase [Chloroflexi bacterium]|nr:phosphoenolpyruvate synthase [Chloroflexota bacterium]
MRLSDRTIVWFNEVTKKDVAVVGGKGANLGELTNAQIPVPPGFIITANAYFDFLRKSRLAEKIRKTLTPLDPGNSKQLHKVADEVKRLILSASIPPDLADQIKLAYKEMGGNFVAVRSSATAEDLPEASFAGQQRTFLNVQGEDKVITAVQECWASLFEPRAIFYRHQQGFDHFQVGIAVPVQHMVQSQVSGVMFTLEPVTSDTGKIVIEAIYGLGEGLVSGEVTPDLYVIDKTVLRIIDKKIARQEWQLVRNPHENGSSNVEAPVGISMQDQQKLTEEEILHLAKLGKHIESHYRFPQDIEWAREASGKFYIVQARPVTTISHKSDTELIAEITAPVILSGAPASPGMASGPVRIITDPAQIHKVRKGDVLVAEMTTPDFVPAMKRAVAIVTDRGGRTAHAAIVSRELGIPCIVGAGQATTTLKNDQVVTIDGSQGKVYEGKVAQEIRGAVSDSAKEAIKTKTRVYVNLAQPELAENVACRNVDGVGLLRAEFIVAQIGQHPRYMLKENRGDEFIEKLYEGLNTFAKAFDPRPVVYRFTDFKTNEYRDLVGGAEFEEAEENPMLGYRGCSRYVNEPDAFELEIKAIQKVRETYKNLWAMVPFVRTVDELKRTKALIESFGLKQSDDFKLWMMVEVPSNIFLLEQFLDVGIDGISIGSNDLTQLILGIDRDSPKLAHEFDERNEAVMLALGKAIKVARSRGVTASICGQAPSVYPELTEKLVEWGITSVSVSPDMIARTREIIAKAEAKLKR